MVCDLSLPNVLGDSSGFAQAQQPPGGECFRKGSVPSIPARNKGVSGAEAAVTEQIHNGSIRHRGSCSLS